MNRTVRSHKGFILPMALVATVITLLTVAAGSAYYTNVARRSREYLSRTSCRLAAQSAIELAKLQINDCIESWNGGSSDLVAVDASQTATSVQALLQNLRYASPTNIGGCTIRFGHDNAKIVNAEEGGNVQIPIYATATVDAGGRSVSVTLQESVLFNKTQSQIFDYAYFASNKGHLEGSRIRINGDVRSNGDFNIDAATINGFVYASGDVTLRNSPKIWAARKYNDAIASEYRENGVVFAPVRPTNPPNPDAAEPIDWYGGFDAPGAVTQTVMSPTGGFGGFFSLFTRKTTPRQVTSTELTITKDGADKTVAGSGEPIVHENIAPLALPQLENMDEYRALAERQHGSLTCMNGAPSNDGRGFVPWTVDCTRWKADTRTERRKTGEQRIVRYESVQVLDHYETKQVFFRTVQTPVYRTEQKPVYEDVYEEVEVPTGSYSKDTVSRTVRKVVVTNGHTIDNSETRYADCVGDTRNIRPFERDELSAASEAADRGAVILIGSDEYPIVIDGPVVFESDVLVAGVVSGQGTIYSGRNIHIIGDITYRNPPSWPHPDTNPEQARAENAGRDMLALICRGNIVVGDYTDGDWDSKVKPYVNGSFSRYGKSYGNYCQIDAGHQKAVFSSAESKAKKDRYGRTTGTEPNLDTGRMTTAAIKKYESVCGDYVIQGLAQTEVDGNSADFRLLSRLGKWIRHYLRSIGKWDRYRNRAYDSFAYWQSAFRTWLFGSGSRYYGGGNYANYDSGITEIDAVLYSSHGIFGLVGGARSGCTISGAVICQDECLTPYHRSFFGSTSFRIDWDMRLKANGAESLAGKGLPESIRHPRTATWQEVPTDHNPAWRSDR